MKLTEFGKFSRKLRIDNGELLKDMAIKLNVTVSYLSAVEIGKRNIPEKWEEEKPIFVGASDGGMVAQIYIQKYPGEAGGMVLVSTGGMDAETLKTLKKKKKT